MTDQHTQPTPQAPAATVPPQGKRPWWRHPGVAATAALLVGVGIGATTAETDPTTTPAYRQLSDQRDLARSDLEQSRADLAQSQVDLAVARDEVETLAGDLPDREADLAAALDQLAEDQKTLRAAQKTLRAAEKKVAARERKVGIVEQTIARNTIAGDGMYEAGVDIKPGTYKTAGGARCYYAVLNSPDTFDIETNNNIEGPGILTVDQGQYLMLSGCADWVWQR